MERVVQTERQCWANAQYSRRGTIKVIDILSSIRDKDLEDKLRNIFEEIGVNVNKRDIQACHRLRKKDLFISNYLKIHKVVFLLNLLSLAYSNFINFT